MQGRRGPGSGEVSRAVRRDNQAVCSNAQRQSHAVAACGRRLLCAGAPQLPSLAASASSEAMSPTLKQFRYQRVRLPLVSV